MPVNKLIYPDDYPVQIIGPSELELRLAELEERLRLAGLQIGQGRRESGQEAIDVRSQAGATNYRHNVLARFSSDGLVRGTKALISGGQTDEEISSTVVKLGYDTESLIPIGAVLGVPRHSMGSADTSSAGFVAGGSAAAGTSSAIDKLDFTVEATFSLNATLASARSELVGIGTPSESYYFGGIDTSSAFLNKIEALNHPQNNIRAIGATLGSPRSNSAGIGNTASGYVCGGKTGLGETYVSSIDKFNFGSELRTPVSVGLGVATAFAASVGNWLNGYICGGKNVGVSASTIYRFVYGTEASVPISIALTTARADTIGCGSSVKGYLMGGGTNQSGEFKASVPSTTIERLTMISDRVNTESIQLLSISLGSSYLGGSASSDYSATVAEQGVATIANLYDDIYYRKELTLPRTELRRRLTGNITFYVDANYSGVRSGVYGSATNPAARINDAIYHLAKSEPIDAAGYSVKIKVMPGTYVESLVFEESEWVGTSRRNNVADLILEGDPANPSLVKLQTSPATDWSTVKIVNNLAILIDGFELSTTIPRPLGSLAAGLDCLVAIDGGILVYRNLIFKSAFQAHVAIGSGSVGGQLGKIQIVGNLPSEPVVVVAQHVFVGESARWYGCYDPQLPSTIEFINSPQLSHFINVYGGVGYFSVLPVFLGGTIGKGAILLREGTIELPWGNLLRGGNLPFLPTSNSQVDNYNSRRDRLTADTTISIDNAYTVARAGVYGTPTNPCPSIAAGIEYASKFDLSGYRLTLQVAPGVYDESVIFNAAEWVGTARANFGADVYLRGDPAAPASTIIVASTPQAIRILKQIVVLVDGFKFVSTQTGNSAIKTLDGATLMYANLAFGSGFGDQIVAGYNSKLFLVGAVKVEGSCTRHIAAYFNSFWHSGYSDVNYPGPVGSSSPRIDLVGSPALDSLFLAGKSEIDFRIQPIFTGLVNGKPLRLFDGSICRLPWGELIPGGTIPFIPTTDPTIGIENGIRAMVVSRPYLWVNNSYTSTRSGQLGSGSNPFGSIGAAIQYLTIADLGDYGATILLAPGVYTESAIFEGEKVRAFDIELVGDEANPGNYTVRTSDTTGTNTIFVAGMSMTIKGVRFDSVRSSYNVGIAVSRGQLYYKNCIFSYGLSDHIVGNLNSQIIPIGNYRVEGSGNSHIRLTNRSSFYIGSGSVTIDNQPGSYTIGYTFSLAQNSNVDLTDTLQWVNTAAVKKARIASGSRIVQTSNPTKGGLALSQVPGTGIDIFSDGTIIFDYEV